ncbi:AlpA family phage regulatory protein [Bradyrhizobium sp. LMTR 3]|uniref:helix-turn-helix transcriptional regulator n=1 Tax=Bradyrhizobium sp. LMTR 3 TaxID=189873 RepID=UPI000A049755|nr:AlpA family phage regulatory protein [Bradyrhizobium sp. LMTR 3]
MDASSVCLLHAADLYKLGVRYSRQHLDRLEKAGQFPRRVKLTPNGRVGWVQSEIHDWLKDRIDQSRLGPANGSPSSAYGGQHVRAR